MGGSIPTAGSFRVTGGEFGGSIVSDSESVAQNSGRSLVVPAYAKVNLTFEVLGRRPDGLHDVATVLQTISLADRLRVEPGDGITLHHRGPQPSSDDDLIVRAARLLQKRTGTRFGCAIECVKRIPIAAGLGGGSADAAATLRTLNQLWETHLDAMELAKLASDLGADVPFFIEGGTTLGTGTGGDLAPLPDAPGHWLVLVPVPSGDARKTAEMFTRLESRDVTDGSAAGRQAAAVAAGGIDYSAVGSAFGRLAAERWPRTAASLGALREARAGAASVSGAGPSVFGLYEKRAAAIGGLASVRAAGLPARLYRFTPRMLVSMPASEAG
jgi:4-diphosphocytidyl-2-C-methyl-D-erythritol kinase